MIHTCLQTSLTSTSKWYLRISSYKLTNHGRHETNIFLCVVFSLYTKYVHSGPNRVSIVEFIVGNTVEFVNVTMNMTMNLTNSGKASENSKKKKVLAPTKN